MKVDFEQMGVSEFLAGVNTSIKRLGGTVTGPDGVVLPSGLPWGPNGNYRIHVPGEKSVRIGSQTWGGVGEDYSATHVALTLQQGLGSAIEVYSFERYYEGSTGSVLETAETTIETKGQ